MIPAVLRLLVLLTASLLNWLIGCYPHEVDPKSIDIGICDPSRIQAYPVLAGPPGEVYSGGEPEIFHLLFTKDSPGVARACALVTHRGSDKYGNNIRVQRVLPTRDLGRVPCVFGCFGGVYPKPIVRVIHFFTRKSSNYVEFWQ
jgi:hypothetical protein